MCNIIYWIKASQIISHLLLKRSNTDQGLSVEICVHRNHWFTSTRSAFPLNASTSDVPRGLTKCRTSHPAYRRGFYSTMREVYTVQHCTPVQDINDGHSTKSFFYQCFIFTDSTVGSGILTFVVNYSGKLWTSRNIWESEDRLVRLCWESDTDIDAQAVSW